MSKLTLVLIRNLIKRLVAMLAKQMISHLDTRKIIMRYVLALFFTILILQPSNATQQGDKKTPDDALTSFISECANKDAESCYGVAMKLSRDLKNAGNPANEQEAKSIFKHYELACDYGNFDGCYAIARAYLDESMFTTKDVDKAIKYLENACLASQIRACSDLANLYQNSSDVTKDLSKSTEYYAKGCEFNDAYMCLSLAHAYTRSQGVKRDMQQSLKYQAKACALGFQRACVAIGGYYRDGEYVEQNSAKAIDYFELGCDADNESSDCISARKYINSAGNNLLKTSDDYISKEISAELGQVIVCTPAYNSSSFSDGCNPIYKKKYSAKLSFFVRDDELISLKPESLIINLLKIDGVNAKRDTEGGRNFELDGTTIESSHQGNRYLSWNIKVYEGVELANSSLELQGSVMAISSHTSAEVESNPFSVSNFKSFKVGPVSIQGNRSKNLRYGLEQAAKKLPDVSTRTVDILAELIESQKIQTDQPRLDITQTEIHLLDISNSEKNSVRGLKRAYELWSRRWLNGSMVDEEYGKFILNINSGARVVKKVMLLHGDKIVGVSESSEASLSEDGDSSTHYFDIPTADEVKVKLVYWDDPQTVKINFGIKP